MRAIFHRMSPVALSNAANQEEVNRLLQTITDIASTTKFGTVKVLDGTVLNGGTGSTFQIGGFSGENTTLNIGGRREKVSKLDLPLRITGALDNPRVLFRDQDLKKALIAAGKGKLISAAEKHVPDDLKKKAGGLIDKFK